MKKHEKDLITLALARWFLKGTNKSIRDFIPNYDEAKIKELLKNMKLLDSDITVTNAFSHYLNDAYRCVIKKHK